MAETSIQPLSQEQLDKAHALAAITSGTPQNPETNPDVLKNIKPFSSEAIVNSLPHIHEEALEALKDQLASPTPVSPETPPRAFK